MGNWFSGLQSIGKALMLPIAVLPAAALLLRFGAQELLNIPLVEKAGAAVFGNPALLFAIGIAVGLAKDNNLVDISSCITRLRLTVRDSDRVNEAEFKRMGVAGVVK